MFPSTPSSGILSYALFYYHLKKIHFFFYRCNNTKLQCFQHENAFLIHSLTPGAYVVLGYPKSRQDIPTTVELTGFWNVKIGSEAKVFYS